MLLFYEQNNLSQFKKIFIEQNEFAVKNVSANSFNYMYCILAHLRNLIGKQ